MAQTQVREIFKVTKNGQEIELAVREPTVQDGDKARSTYRKTFATALQDGAILRLNLERKAREQGLWSDEKDKKQQDLEKAISDKLIQLKSGGIKLNDAKNVALDIKKLRDERRNLLSEKNSMDLYTAEGQADNARFNSLVASCLVYNKTGEPYYKNLDDYLANSTNEEAFKAAQLLAKMLYGLDEKFEQNLPENQFLKKYKFVDEDLQLVNKEGKLVDEEGRLIDKEGRYINEKNEFVDKFGRKVDKDGEYIVESQPFLDDDGNPISEDSTTKIATEVATEVVTEVAA